MQNYANFAIRMNRSIDVVIPSFRLNPNELLPILELPHPQNFTINFYLIADNPQIEVPASIRQFARENRVCLIINESNLGYSQTRNKGIDAGAGDWVLLLDDDIQPSSSLLIEYARAIEQFPQAIGFAGPTFFPPVFNNVTKALVNNGSIGHFESASRCKEVVWVPTSNVLLNRKLLMGRRFNTALKLGGEDVAFLTENSLAHDQKYICVPNASVTHPWWDEGKPQAIRLFRYGAGTSQIMRISFIRPYTFIDFPNTVESVFGLLLLSLIFILTGLSPELLLILLGAILVAEVVVTLFRGIKGTGCSPEVAWQMFYHKQAYELGQFWMAMRMSRGGDFARRVDLGFSKQYPSPFRLNKWKIIKLGIVSSIMACVYTVLR